MGKGVIRQLRAAREQAPDLRSGGVGPQQRTTFFFNLEPLLPHPPVANGFSRTRLMVESRLQRIVRRRDRIVWTARGFYLVIASDHFDRALVVAERVRDHILEHCAGLHELPLAKLAMRVASPSELEGFGLMSA